MTPHPPRWHDPALLDHLARVRRPWDGLVRRVVGATLTKYLPDPPGPLAEVGAGGGQLRDWLPAELAAETTHTEPSEPLLAVLRQRHPDADAAPADATALPFPAGSLAAVLGLCVLDTVPDLLSVRDEVRRVLRPGGVVVHFLDLATSPDTLFPELIAGGELPLTNFARDPALLEVLTDPQKSLLPPAGDFDEVLAVRWDAFASFAGMLEAANHPLASDLGPYRGLTRPGGLDPDRLAREFMAASGDPDRLGKLNRALLALTLTARGMGREWPLRAVSAREHLRAKLRAAFAPGHGFAVEFAGPVAAWEAAPEGSPFVLRHAGRTVSRPHVLEIPGTPVTAWEDVPTTAGERARATTVEVFVARRSG
jgi:SAM-dependent methyltransferase